MWKQIKLEYKVKRLRNPFCGVLKVTEQHVRVLDQLMTHFHAVGPVPNIEMKFTHVLHTIREVVGKLILEGHTVHRNFVIK